ncbi:hypothetical protein CIK05_11840 [Bdellovibrio sp. qaytius]|nr:hypothetical protein CIK05_11840 [Bdellovibrio sp. qaytius]
MPNRTASEGVMFNIEGSVFRNKARVFTSLYIVDPECLEKKEKLIITEFGRALGLGYVNESQFYEFIITRFEYPHPAYEDNWDAWTEAKKTLKPLLFILDILLELHDLDDEGVITTNELAMFAFSNCDQTKAKEIANSIYKSRKSKADTTREKSDQIDRKISDLLGFLCIAGFCYYEANSVCLNLMDRHKEEGTFFWGKRDGQDRKHFFKMLIKNGK